MGWSWYTKGRRIPTLIGKDVSGRRIPGGPYTGLQASTAAAVPTVLWWTRGLWAADMAGLAMFAVLVGVTVGAVKLAGKVDFASRNPLLLLGGYLRQMSRPAAGTLAGRKLAEPRPHRVSAPVGVAHLEPSDLPAVALPTDDTLAEPAEATEPVQPVEQSATPALAEEVDATHLRRSTGADEVSPGTVAAALRPATPLAPDRRRTGLEAFLAGAATRTASPEEDAA